jgi:hypothetical protein
VDRPIDFSLPVRKGVVAHLRGYAPLTDLVSSARIWGEQPKDTPPEWPFIKMGFQIATPWFATRLSGSGNAFSIDAYVRGPYTDDVYKVAAAIVAGMQTLKLPTLDLRDLQWTGTQVGRDTEEANDYHAVIGYTLIATQTE